MIGREIPITFLESPDIVFSLVPDQDWYLKVDQISPTLVLNVSFSITYCINVFDEKYLGLQIQKWPFLGLILTEKWVKRAIFDVFCVNRN